jgi:hypothetical protein
MTKGSEKLGVTAMLQKSKADFKAAVRARAAGRHAHRAPRRLTSARAHARACA